VQTAGQLEPHPTCGSTQQDSCSVECVSWLLRIPIWLEANYIILRTSHFFSLSSSSSLPRQQIVAPQTPQQGTSISELSRTTGALTMIPPTVTRPQHSYNLVHHNAANAATKNKTQDPHLKSSVNPEEASIRGSPQQDVRLSVSRYTAIDLTDNILLVSIQSCVTSW